MYITTAPLLCVQLRQKIELTNDIRVLSDRPFLSSAYELPCSNVGMDIFILERISFDLTSYTLLTNLY
jgi:hypothetical protein